MNSVAKSLHLRFMLGGVALATLIAGSAQATQFQECVGTYDLSFPSEVDVATTTPLFFGRKYVAQPIQFPDGEPASLSSFKLNGEFEIVNGITLSDYSKIINDVKLRISKAAEQNDDLSKTVIPIDRPNTFAYFGSFSSALYVFKNSGVVTYRAAATDLTAEEGKRSVEEVLDGLKFRQNYEIPKGDGVCMPGIFIAITGKSYRDIGVTFRLQEHPDVTIFFKDKASAKPVTMVDVHNMPVGRQTNLTSREQNEFVWKYSGLGAQVKLDHDPMPFHTVELDGRKGVSSFGTITRDDGTTDYGYLATVQGDPDAPVDTPDLMLLVQRTAKNAKSNTPGSKEELKQIAKDIAASVKRRSIR
jgi:hypothetical protein